MDRRMYRRSGENPGSCSRNTCKQTPVCGDVSDRFSSSDTYDRDTECDIDRLPLGMCYVPWQHFRNLYENEFVAIAHGTIFKELDLEFCGRSCK
jgi:hypothetical protein